MPDPTPPGGMRRLHDWEQTMAGLRTLGHGLSTMHRAMVENGMTRDEATRVVCQYAAALAHTRPDPPTHPPNNEGPT